MTSLCVYDYSIETTRCRTGKTKNDTTYIMFLIDEMSVRGRKFVRSIQASETSALKFERKSSALVLHNSTFLFILFTRSILSSGSNDTRQSIFKSHRRSLPSRASDMYGTNATSGFLHLSKIRRCDWHRISWPCKLNHFLLRQVESLTVLLVNQMRSFVANFKATPTPLKSGLLSFMQ